MRQFSAGKSFTDYESDAMLRSAVERQFEIIGEALNQLRKVDAELASAIRTSIGSSRSASLFTTLVDGDAPYQADYDDFSPRGLAALAREFAFNDPHADPNAVGAVTDRNTELLVAGRAPVR
nr:DUF86 domain-containing protein [Saccharothrix sp. ALI-22-I]